MNARLPKTPQRQALPVRVRLDAGLAGQQNPHRKRENWKAAVSADPRRSNGEQDGSFKAARIPGSRAGSRARPATPAKRRFNRSAFCSRTCAFPPWPLAGDRCSPLENRLATLSMLSPVDDARRRASRAAKDGGLRMAPRAEQEPRPWATPMLGAFAHPAFAIVWTASTCALIGIAMYDTASGWLMTTFDLNPFDVSLVHAATTLPIFLFTLPAGAIADIVDPRRMIIAVSYAIAALMAIFAAVVALNFASPVLLLLTTFVLSAAWSLNTPAWLSIVPQLVPKPEIPGAIAAHSVGYNLSRTLGPALGGLIIVSYGAAAPFWIFIAANLAVIAALTWWRAPARQSASLPAERLSSALRTGLRHAANNRLLVGDAGANDRDLSVHRGLLGPLAVDRPADRRGRGALRPPAQRDQRRSDPRIARTWEAAPAGWAPTGWSPRDRPDRGRARRCSPFAAQIFRSRSAPPARPESRGSTT